MGVHGVTGPILTFGTTQRGGNARYANHEPT